MSFTDQNERQAAEYLLGGLEEPERIQLQQRLFEDDSYFALLLDVENDLMDAYAAGKLSGEDRQRFARQVKECHAEAVAYVVAHHFGIRAVEPVRDYHVGLMLGTALALVGYRYGQR